MTPRPLILPMPGNEGFARDLADAGGGEIGTVETRRFPDGETYLRLLTPVAGRAVDLVATLAGPDPDFLRLAFAADAARAQGAVRVRLVAPYLAYMRQDKAFRPGEAVTSDSFARLISSLFDGLVTVDPHLHRRAALSELYSIPAAAVQAAPALADWITAEVPRPLLIGPDSESAQWVQAIAERISAPWTVMEKTRRGDYDVSVELPDLSGHAICTPVLIDDIASSGRTMIAAANLLAARGLARPVCAVVHPLFAGDAFARIQAVAARVVSCDSVPHPSNAIPLAPLVAAALTALPERSRT
ncbi:ribose-phosphate diphosphokinase [Tabrizicola fusiformis]|jgi:ribose-phosphate pyrophosphokinase|uniref:ribose-phosphate diphosphokinase n=1 Tax=Tabrizicola sp. SY72 TaxID=2741673 RepID=UPI001571EE4A|nr:ribose-phosphate diphosphokinase [Tabrizicola sp. SY72]NTT87566.1 ribose-phosphate diphosphokinase [Tabrizicola sp. SY72]